MARVHVYRTYRFIDKDPIIDAVRTVVEDTHLSHHKVHEVSGVAQATLDNWFEGSTRRPQNTTVTAVTSALGYVRADSLNPDGTVAVGFKKARRLDYQQEIEKQADWLLKHGTPKQKKSRRRKKAGAKSNGGQAQ